MILIFDTYGGLCNQMYDIHHAINFCIIYNISFSFRFSCFREKEHLTKWYNVKFSDLFDDSFIQNVLYLPYNQLHIDKQQCLDNGLRAIEWLDKERALLPQLDRIEEKYIVLKQFWSICPPLQNEINFYEKIMPCQKLYKFFQKIVQKLPVQYNYIHYRYENDFIEHFQIQHHPKLCELIQNISFTNPDLKIYVACYEITKLYPKNISQPIWKFKQVLYKKNSYDHLNFEEQAFIDFLIGKQACEIYGHSKSSFSWLLNASKNSQNYYDH